MAENNAASPKPSGTPPVTTPQNTRQHHLLAEGKKPDVGGGKSTRW